MSKGKNTASFKNQNSQTRKLHLRPGQTWAAGSALVSNMLEPPAEEEVTKIHSILVKLFIFFRYLSPWAGWMAYTQSSLPEGDQTMIKKNTKNIIHKNTSVFWSQCVGCLGPSPKIWSVLTLLLWFFHWRPVKTHQVSAAQTCITDLSTRPLPLSFSTRK